MNGDAVFQLVFVASGMPPAVFLSAIIDPSTSHFRSASHHVATA